MSEIVNKLVEEFLNAVSKLNNTVVKLDTTISHQTDLMMRLLDEISGLRREFSNLTGKLELVISRK